MLVSEISELLLFLYIYKLSGLVERTEGEERLSLVEFGHVDLDMAKVGPLGWVLGPAALHQDGQLLRVAFVVRGGPEVRLLTVPDLLHDLWRKEGHTVCSQLL